MVVPAVKKLSKDDSHLTTVPVRPVKVSVVLLVPLHTFPPPPVMLPLAAPVTVTLLVDIGVEVVISPGIPPYSVRYPASVVV